MNRPPRHSRPHNDHDALRVMVGCFFLLSALGVNLFLGIVAVHFILKYW